MMRTTHEVLKPVVGPTKAQFEKLSASIIKFEQAVREIGIEEAVHILALMRKIQQVKDRADIAGGAEAPANPLIRGGKQLEDFPF